MAGSFLKTNFFPRYQRLQKDQILFSALRSGDSKEKPSGSWLSKKDVYEKRMFMKKEEWDATPIDLHMHSLFSDGSFSVPHLVESLAENHLGIFALTDHDTLQGLDLAKKEAAKKGLKTIGGLEISAQDAKGAMHILGYFVGQQDEVLQNCLEKLNQARENRNRMILEQLTQMGFPMQEEELKAFAPESSVLGRPHIARLMVQKKYVSSYAEAFKNYLGNKARVYFNKETLSPDQAIAAIHHSEGWPFLAHPCTLNRSAAELKNLLFELKDMGLKGVEVYNSAHSFDQVQLYQKLSNDAGLLFSGGSDFHGANKPYLEIGNAFLGKKITGRQVSADFYDRYTEENL